MTGRDRAKVEGILLRHSIIHYWAQPGFLIHEYWYRVVSLSSSLPPLLSREAVLTSSADWLKPALRDSVLGPSL